MKELMTIDKIHYTYYEGEERYIEFWVDRDSEEVNVTDSNMDADLDKLWEMVEEDVPEVSEAQVWKNRQERIEVEQIY